MDPLVLKRHAPRPVSMAVHATLRQAPALVSVASEATTAFARAALRPVALPIHLAVTAMELACVKTASLAPLAPVRFIVFS